MFVFCIHCDCLCVCMCVSYLIYTSIPFLCRNESIRLSAAHCLGTIVDTLPKFLSSFINDLITTVTHTIYSYIVCLVLSFKYYISDLPIDDSLYKGRETKSLFGRALSSQVNIVTSVMSINTMSYNKVYLHGHTGLKSLY